jgi:hypothetical protein
MKISDLTDYLSQFDSDFEVTIGPQSAGSANYVDLGFIIPDGGAPRREDSPDAPDVILVDGTPLSVCHKAPLEVERSVHDIVAFNVEGFDETTNSLQVRYGKVYEGEGDEFSVTCSQCGAFQDITVVEL